MQDEPLGEPGRTPGAQPAAELAGPVSEALRAADPGAARALVERLEAPDLADLIALLDPELRAPLIEALGPAFRPEVLTELDEAVRDQLLPALPRERLADAIAELETDDAAYLLENLDPAVRQEILGRIPTADRAALERNLEYPQETAGRLMQTDFVAVPPFWTVGQVIDHMREADDLRRPSPTSTWSIQPSTCSAAST
jgi:magnesium transporter